MKKKMSGTGFRVCRDEHYLIKPCVDCHLPGYLIVSPISGASSIAELTKEEQAALGGALAKAIEAVQKAVQPVRIYCAQFGEKGGPLHFHVFPRTEEVTREYLRENPLRGGMIDGPDLLNWARRKYGCYNNQGDSESLIRQI
jgi:diadenosine tetraphosphate (Ap4A) HIT family hydrolase